MFWPRSGYWLYNSFQCQTRCVRSFAVALQKFTKSTCERQESKAVRNIQAETISNLSNQCHGIEMA